MLNSFYLKFKIVDDQKSSTNTHLLISFIYKIKGRPRSERIDIKSFRHKELGCIKDFLSSFSSTGSISSSTISDEKKEALFHIVAASVDLLRDGLIGFAEEFLAAKYFKENVFVPEKLNLSHTSYLIDSIIRRGLNTNHRIRFGISDISDFESLKKGLIHKYGDGFHCTLSLDDGYLFYIIKKISGIQFYEIAMYSIHGKKRGSKSFPLNKMKGEIKWAKLIVHN